MNLWVDDLRDPEQFRQWYTSDAGWVWVKTITEAIRLLSSQPITEVSLDHDICHAIHPGDPADSGNNIYQPVVCPEDYTSVAHYIAAMPESERPENVYIHTANEIGSGRLHEILRGKVKNLKRVRL